MSETRKLAAILVADASASGPVGRAVIQRIVLQGTKLNDNPDVVEAIAG